MSARTGDSVKTVVPKSFMANTRIELELGGANRHQSSVGFVCVEVLRPSQPNGVMLSAVSLPNHTFTGQLSPQSG